MVLGAKMKALIRRDIESFRPLPDFITAGPFCYNSMTMELFKDKRPIPLSSRGECFNEAVSVQCRPCLHKEQLYEHVWNGSVVDANTIMVYISHLRNKIEEDPKTPVSENSLGAGLQIFRKI